MTTITSVTVLPDPDVPPNEPSLGYYAAIGRGTRNKLYNISAASIERVAFAIWELQCRGGADVRPFLASHVGYVATIGEGLR